MKLRFIFAIATGVAVPALAQEDLARKHNCLACHAVAQKVVGPSFKEIAGKYRGNSAAAGNLAEKVKKGSTGVWGAIPMPPNGTVPDGDITQIVTWILSQ